MPKLTETDRTCIWRSRIKISQGVRDKQKEEVWSKNLMSFRGKLKPLAHIWSNDDPWVSVELVHSSIRAAIPSLLYNNPSWTVYPTKPEHVSGPEGEKDISWDKARSKELWLNHIWKEGKVNKHIRVAMTAAFLAYGAVKVGYAPVFEDDDTRGEFETTDDGSLIPIGRPDQDGNQKYKLTKGQYLTDENDEIVWDEDSGLPVLHPGKLQREKFFVEWMPWENLLFDPEGGNEFENHRYVIEEWVRPLVHVQEDPRYKPSVRKKIRASSTIRSEVLLNYENPNSTISYEPYDPKGAIDNDEARVRGWDIYDFEENRMMVLVDEVEGAESNDVFLLDNRMPDGIEHGPFCFLKFNEDPGCWYQKTDAEGMAKLELEYNVTRSQMLTHRNQSRARYFEVGSAGFEGVEGGDKEREKFASGPSGVLVRVKSADGVVPARKDALDQSFFAAIPNIRGDFSEVAGTPGEARGIADSDTATQASLLAAGADVRNNDRRDNLVQTFLAEIATKLLQSAQANISEVAWVKIARGPEDPHPFDFEAINPEDIDGNFEVGVVVGSTQPKNSAARVALYERILTIISQNPVIAASPTLMRRIFEGIDLVDENLIAELQRIGEAAVQGMQKPAGGAEETSQVQGPVNNQFMTGGANAAAGIPTGANAN